MRGYVLCRQLSWQNFSFYFVLNLDTGPFISLGISSIFTLSIPKTFHLFGYFFRFYPLCTQNISSLWVFLLFYSLYTQSYFFSCVYRLFSSPYTPNAMLHVHTMAYRRSVFRLTHTRRILLFGIFRLRRVASTT